MTRRFFFDSHYKAPLNKHKLGDVISITETIHHHWCKVLRAKIGEKAIFFDGLGGEYQVELVEVNKKEAWVKLLSFSNIDNTAKIRTQIGLVMSRGDRMDYAIQKATEMGVTAIQLLTSQHGEVRLKSTQVAKKLNHWQQVAISACEQCGMNRVPIIQPPMPLNCWLEIVNSEKYPLFENICDYIKAITIDDFYQKLKSKDDLSLVLAVPKDMKQSESFNLAQFLPLANNVGKIDIESIQNDDLPYIRLLIGPEGGLSIEEIHQAKSNNFISWQIGNRVLRTETAPVVALATLQALLN